MCALLINNGFFVFQGNTYLFHDLLAKNADTLPKSIQAGFSIPYSTIDAALRWDDQTVFFFKGMDYVKYDMTKKAVVPGYPKKIFLDWKGIWPSDLSDAMMIHDKVFFFRRAQYISYDIQLGKADNDYPRPITDGWHGVWNNIDGAEYMGQDKALFLKDGQVILYDLKYDRADTGYPTSLHSHLKSYGEENTPDGLTAAAKTIHAYASAIITAKNKIATNYLSAIDNFRTLIQSAVPSEEIQPHVLSSVLQIGLATIEKILAATLKEPIRSALQPIIDLTHGASDTINTEANHALSGTDWLDQVQQSLTNLFSADQSAERLKMQLESDCELYDEETRDSHITNLKNEMTVLQTLELPSVEKLELAIYTAWINQNVAGEGLNDPGHIEIRVVDDGNRNSATVQAPFGDKIASALNGIMAKAGISRLANLDVVKKVFKGDVIAYFERDNSLRSNHEHNDSSMPFMLDDSWKNIERFTA